MTRPERNLKPSETVVGRAKNILKYLQDYRNMLFLAFMCDALEPLHALSQRFQEDTLTACQAGEALFSCFLSLEELKQQPDLIMTEIVQAMAQTGNYKGVTLKGL